MKAEENPYPYVTLDEQGSDPATPDTGLWRLYAKAAGIHVKDDGGSVTGPFGTGGGGTPRICRVHNSGAQSISNTTETTLTFDTEDADASGIHSGGTFTIPSGGGDWEFMLLYEWAGGGGDYRFVYVKLNDTTYVAVQSKRPAGGTGYANDCFNFKLYGLSAGDTIKFRVLQNSGGNLNIGNQGANILTTVIIREIL